MDKKVISTIITSALGGITLLIATLFLNAFLSSPPTRAEFDTFKATMQTQSKSIDRRLNNLEKGQSEIIKTIISQGVKK